MVFLPVILMGAYVRTTVPITHNATLTVTVTACRTGNTNALLALKVANRPVHVHGNLGKFFRNF
jgi:hypothetical protein